MISEGDARQLLQGGFDVSRETMRKLDLYVDLLRTEAERQNLVSARTLPTLWSRHILDSAQLVRFRRSQNETWLDLGSGAGLPGVVVAAMHEGEVTLLEQRRLRTAFLQSAIDTVGLGARCRVVTARAETADLGKFDIISARAFAPLKKLLKLGFRFCHPGTRWILPKGRSAQSELDDLSGSWQGVFSLERSMTDPDAQIIIADNVAPARGSAR
jgi:16S rRNA (guanine527-N7)-methyltransferase